MPDRKSAGGTRYYDVEDDGAWHARVSSHDQNNDLVRQQELLEAFCAAKGWRNEVIADLGSGLNYKKKGLNRLLELILRKRMRRLVLTHKDRLLRHWALAEWQKQYKAGGKPSEVSLRRQLNAVKREQFPWMFDVTKCAVQEAIIDLGSSFRAFFDKRGRYPRFKRKGDKASFCAANEAGTFRTEAKRIKLPVIGWIKMREEVRFSGPLKRATVSCEAGRWFVALMIETDDVQPVSQPEATVGVDLGVTHAGNLVDRRSHRRPEGTQGSPEAVAAAEQVAVSQARWFAQLQESQGTTGTVACPNCQCPPRRQPQTDDAANQNLCRDRHRRSQRARHGGQPSSCPLDHGRRLLRIPPSAHLQGEALRLPSRDGWSL